VKHALAAVKKCNNFNAAVGHNRYIVNVFTDTDDPPGKYTNVAFQVEEDEQRSGRGGVHYHSLVHYRIYSQAIQFLKKHLFFHKII
jgi:hypothetical protein